MKSEYRLFKHPMHRERTGRCGIWTGLLIMVIGAALLMHALNLLVVPWSLVWPSILIVVGIRILLGLAFSRGNGRYISDKNQCTDASGVIESQ